MSNFPTAMDSVETLYTPVDASSVKTLETTTTAPVLAGDSTIPVASTSVGFASTYGVMSIDDEIIIYASKTATQFSGCQRGAFGTAAVSHSSGAIVRANMVAGFLTSLQDAVIKIETDLGTSSSRNYVRRDGAVTVTGIKTFTDGAEFGSGTKSGTGLVRLPNNGGLKWRKSDNSGDLGIVLNASDHIQMDAVIDFAAGQTFGAFSYPDATTTTKGLVQVDPVGGITITSGVIGLANTGVIAATYTKVTVDAKGRVTSGANLSSGDLPSHTHPASDIVSGAAPVGVQRLGSSIGTRRNINFIPGSGATIVATDDPTNNRVDVTISSFGGGGTEHPSPYQTVGAPCENLFRLSEDFYNSSVWVHNSTCSVTPNSVVAPDGNTTADAVEAIAGGAILTQYVTTGLVPSQTYTFYVWLKAPSSGKSVSLGVMEPTWTTWQSGPMAVNLTTSWQRYQITVTSSESTLWFVIVDDGANDTWGVGEIIHVWGACLQTGNDPQKSYVRTWDAPVNPYVGTALGRTFVMAKDTTESPFRVLGPASQEVDDTLFAVNNVGEITVAGGTSYGYMLSGIEAAVNPAGWSGVIKVKNTAGVTAGYILLYANP